jgi:phosphomannomutase/phosphoglucomutase
LLNALPDAIATPELHLHCAEGEHYALIAKLQREAKFAGAENVIDIDGLRVEYADGFGLMRASNTTPLIVLRFEADNEAAIQRIQAQFRDVLLAAKPDATLPY